MSSVHTARPQPKHAPTPSTKEVTENMHNDWNVWYALMSRWALCDGLCTQQNHPIESIRYLTLPLKIIEVHWGYSKHRQAVKQGFLLCNLVSLKSALIERDLVSEPFKRTAIG